MNIGVFFGIFPESWISAQKQDTKAILLKTSLVRVGCIQNTQISSSNPYHPLHLQWGITHTWMGESWMVDGEASVMMAMISSKSPSRQGARTEFVVAELGFLSVAAKRNSLWKNVEPPSVFRSRGF